MTLSERLAPPKPIRQPAWVIRALERRLPVKVAAR